MGKKVYKVVWILVNNIFEIMKSVIIVYACSWLILLEVYIISLFKKKIGKKRSKAWEQYLNEHKSTKEKAIDKLVYVIMIVFAPLVVFILPYILVRNAIAEKQERIRKEESDKTEREYEEHKAACSENYTRLVGANHHQSNDEYIRIAQCLNKLVENKDYSDILRLLDKTSLPSTMKLDVKECNQEGLGSKSQLFIKTLTYKHLYNIFDYLRFEDSKMGAWQAFLLVRLVHYLPLWWHANYNRRDYIYTKEDFDHITHFVDRGFNKSVLLDYKIDPEITGEDGKYYISCCFWTDFGGLIREYVEISFADNKLKSSFVFEEEVIHEYQCGIMF